MAWKPGESGNPDGRPKGARNRVTQDEFIAALRKVERRRRINLLERYFERALKSDTVLVSVMKKIIPDLKALDMRLDLLVMQNKLTSGEAGSIREKLAARFNADKSSGFPEPVGNDDFVDVNPVSEAVSNQIKEEIGNEDEEERT